MDIELEHQVENHVCFITFRGEMIHERETRRVREYVKPFLENTEIQGLVFEMSELKGIGSVGYGFIVGTLKILMARQAKLVICQLSPANTKMFVKMKLDSVIPLCANREEALSRLR